MIAFDVSYAAAATGGLLSFLSPCVLPLVPAYICFIAGTSFAELTQENIKNNNILLISKNLTQHIALSAIGFILGFTTVFVALGASASAINPLILTHKDVLGRIAGLIIGVFGLHYMGLLRIAVLNHEARLQPEHLDNVQQSLWLRFFSSYIMGLAFAFGWTPCIGPILATILAIATLQKSLSSGIALLTIYSLGLGIPFLIAALAVRNFLNFSTHIRHYMGLIEKTTGLILFGTGILMALDSFEWIAIALISMLPFLGQIG